MKLYQTVWKEGSFRIFIEVDEKGICKVYMPDMVGSYVALKDNSLEINIDKLNPRPAKVEMARVYEGL